MALFKADKLFQNLVRYPRLWWYRLNTAFDIQTSIDIMESVLALEADSGRSLPEPGRCLVAESGSESFIVSIIKSSCWTKTQSLRSDFSITLPFFPLSVQGNIFKKKNQISFRRIPRSKK